MESLIVCSCTHDISYHDANGCGYDGSVRCACKHSRQMVIDAAILATTAAD